MLVSISTGNGKLLCYSGMPASWVWWHFHGSWFDCHCCEPPEGIDVSRSTDSWCLWPLDVKPCTLFALLKGLDLAFNSAKNEGRRHQYKGGKRRLSLPQRPLLTVADGDKDFNTRNIFLFFFVYTRHTTLRNGDVFALLPMILPSSLTLAWIVWVSTWQRSQWYSHC